MYSSVNEISLLLFITGRTKGQILLMFIRGRNEGRTKGQIVDLRSDSDSLAQLQPRLQHKFYLRTYDLNTTYSSAYSISNPRMTKSLGTLPRIFKHGSRRSRDCFCLRLWYVCPPKDINKLMSREKCNRLHMVTMFSGGLRSVSLNSGLWAVDWTGQL